MSESLNMDDFVGLSAILTGFSSDIFAPSLDPVDIKSTYITLWQERVDQEESTPGLAASILNNFANLKAQTNPKLTDQQIGEQILADSSQEMACRKLIYLWYLGAWPTIQADPDNPENTNFSTTFEMISGKSYTSGLVWQVMQAHPMGDSNYRYGYWKSAPADINAYTGKGES